MSTEENAEVSEVAQEVVVAPNRFWNLWKKISWRQTGIVAGAIAGIIFVLFVLWFLLFVTNVDKHELCFVYDRYTGEIEKVDRQGWVVRSPIRHSVHCLDLRPYQLTISANQRVLNAKLVRFNPEGLDTFIEWHGRSAGDSLGNLQEILKCYAFDVTGGKDCPFLDVINEVAPNQSAVHTKNVVMEKK